MECKYCLSDTSPSGVPAIYPCDCQTPVHAECLEHWLEHSNLTRCEICHSHYRNVRIRTRSVNQKCPWCVYCKPLCILLLLGILLVGSAFWDYYYNSRLFIYAVLSMYIVIVTSFLTYTVTHDCYRLEYRIEAIQVSE